MPSPTHSLAHGGGGGAALRVEDGLETAGSLSDSEAALLPSSRPAASRTASSRTAAAAAAAGLAAACLAALALASARGGVSGPAAIATSSAESLAEQPQQTQAVNVLGYQPPWVKHGEARRNMIRSETRRGTPAAAAAPKYWLAPVDHQDANAGTFSQKYYVNDEYYQAGGPVFFELGGEGPVGGPPGGYIAHLASTRNAKLVMVEHRFYGESVPNGNVDTGNLKYLTVDQALADYAAFIDWYTEDAQLPAETKWFAFGGSYPGALSSWFRHAYPEKTVGSLSSSGVVNAIFDFYQFDAHIAEAMGTACADAHRKITAAFERAVLSRGAREAAAKQLFGSPADMSDGDFFYMLADGLAMMVQYGAKTRLCSNITDSEVAWSDESDDDAVMENAAAIINSFWGTDFGSMCFYDTQCLKDPARYVTGGTDRSWRWQKCAQLAYLQSAPIAPAGSAPTALRSSMVDMDYLVGQCEEIFGSTQEALQGAIQAIDSQFGGAQPLAEKVFYSNFGDDPWITASVMPMEDVGGDSVNKPYKAALCDDCGHCSDFRTPKDSEPQEMKDVRARFETYLDQWLAA